MVLRAFVVWPKPAAGWYSLALRAVLYTFGALSLASSLLRIARGPVVNEMALTHGVPLFLSILFVFEALVWLPLLVSKLMDVFSRD